MHFEADDLVIRQSVVDCRRKTMHRKLSNIFSKSLFISYIFIHGERSDASKMVVLDLYSKK